MQRITHLLLIAACLFVLNPFSAYGEQELSAAEKKLEAMALAFEDVAEALGSVKDVSDADLLASRVAVDFLLLRPLHAEMVALKHNPEVNAEYAETFIRRCAEARKTAVAAIQALQKQDFYGSASLPAATSLAALMKGPLAPEKAAPAALELKVNNMEMIVLLLSEVEDKESAETVASLVEYALACGKILEEFATEYESQPIDAESSVYYARRVEDYHVDFGNLAESLKACHYHNSEKLRRIFVSDETIPSLNKN